MEINFHTFAKGKQSTITKSDKNLWHNSTNHSIRYLWCNELVRMCVYGVCVGGTRRPSSGIYWWLQTAPLIGSLYAGRPVNKKCPYGLAVSVSVSHTVGHGFVPRPGHPDDHHINGTNYLPAWHEAIKVRGLSFKLSVLKKTHILMPFNVQIYSNDALLLQNKENKILFGPPPKRLKDTNGRDMSTRTSVFLYNQPVTWIFTRSRLSSLSD